MSEFYDSEVFNSLFTPVDAFNASSGSKYLAYIFDDGNRICLERATAIWNDLIAASPALANLVEGLKSTESVKLVFSDKAIEMLKSGAWKIADSKGTDGLLRAWHVNSEGKFMEHAEVAISQQMQGLNIVQIASAMQSMVMMQKLTEISDQINVLNARVDEIRTGQQNDHVGLFYTAENLYRESEFITNIELRKQLIANAISNLTKCLEQTKQGTLSDAYRIVCNYDAKRNAFRDLKNNARLTPSVKNDLQLIHAASILKAGIYYREGEIQSAVCAFHEYKMFLEALLPNDNSFSALYYADDKSNTIDEFWGVRTILPEMLENTCAILADPSKMQLTSDLMLGGKV